MLFSSGGISIFSKDNTMKQLKLLCRSVVFTLFVLMIVSPAVHAAAAGNEVVVEAEGMGETKVKACVLG